MNLLIISDLHIGNGDAFGTFGWDTEAFIQKIEEIRHRHQVDKIILNGDIYELYKYSLKDIIIKNRELYRYFRGDEFYYIRGNHDAVSRLGHDFFMMENSSGQSIYIEHGHNADYLNGTVPGRIISKFGFFLLKLLTRWPRILKLYFRVVEFEEHLNRLPKRYNTYKYLQYALKLLKTYDLVVLGHTHKLESHHTYYLNKKKRYVNSGSCSLGRFQGVLLDTESLKYEIIRMDKSIKILKNDKPVYIRIPFSA